MNRSRFISLTLLGLVWVTLPAQSPAVDVSASPVSDLGEAKAFFTQLMRTSKNPIIVSMARDTLRKLSPTEAEIASEQGQKRSAEVALLPQSDNTYVVPAMVNKKYMATFLIDTGASYTVITPEMAESIGVEVHGDTPTVPVTTANGTLYAPVVKLRHVSLGGMQVDNVDAVVTPLGDSPQISGLLGMSFFQGMELSFKQDKLVISR